MNRSCVEKKGKCGDEDDCLAYEVENGVYGIESGVWINIVTEIQSLRNIRIVCNSLSVRDIILSCNLWLYVGCVRLLVLEGRHMDG
jgi:hypothetical protein